MQTEGEESGRCGQPWKHNTINPAGYTCWSVWARDRTQGEDLACC